MTKAKVAKVLLVTTSNETGTLARISAVLKEEGLNILHLCASAMDDKAHFIIVVDDAGKGFEAIEALGYEISTTEVLEVTFKNEPGTLAPVAQKLAEADIDINYIFGTTSGGGDIVGLISTDDDQKALEVINEP